MRRIVSWYGAGPLHLLGFLASFAVVGYAAAQLVPVNPKGVLIWFGAAVVGHDLVLFPLYALADRSLVSVLRHRRINDTTLRPLINHLRIPIMGSVMLLIVWSPMILGRASSYRAATGLTTDVYMGRWLAVTAGLFLVSAVLLAIRILRSGRSEPSHQ